MAMTLEEQIGQLFITPVDQSHFEEVRNLLRDRRIGGVLLTPGESRSQVEMIQALEGEADIWTFQDAEWGVGMRLQDVPPLPKNLTLGAIGDAELLRAFGRELARQCHSMGIEVNLAPVMDVLRKRKNPRMDRRSFGDDLENVTRCGLVVMEGMREGGLLACAKHFPGHGDTACDSHVDLPVLDSVDLEPFQALIDAGVEMVMVGHLLYPPLSEEPCSLSHEVMTVLLREKMGFEGLVITDALDMKTLSDRYSMEEVAEKALLAGADLLLVGNDASAIPPMIERIRAEVPVEFIEKKVERILRYKNKPKLPMPEEVVGLRRELYRAALTQVGTVQGAPVVALVQSRPDPDLEWALGRYAEVIVFAYEEIEAVAGFSCVVVNVREGDVPQKLPKGAIVALFDPLNGVSYESALIGYEDVLEAKEAVADALFEKLTPLGKLPIRLCSEVRGNDGRESSK